MPKTRSVLLLATFMSIAVGAPWSSAAGQLVWQALPDMPVGKWETATAVLDDKIHLFGGYIENVRSSKRSDVFDPRDGSWTRLQDMPSAVSHSRSPTGAMAVSCFSCSSRAIAADSAKNVTEESS